MTQQGKRAYHGRRGPAPIVWLIALAVVIATVVLVVAGLSKKPAPDPIPLPGTGAWTGALVAALMGLRIRQALPAIACGVAAAGSLVLLVCRGVIHLAGF